MLELKGVDVYYGKLYILKGINVSVKKGEIVTIIGANGAGKTTTLRTISGLVHPRGGSIYYNGKEITRESSNNIVKMGISHCPEGRQLFPYMTVRENLLLGAYLRNDTNAIKEDMEWVYSIFPILAERQKQIAGTLSGGEQEMLAIGRALMSRPKLLMLDEPSLGLAPIVVDKIFDVIKELNGKGVTILLVEQNANMALEIAHRGYVMETGKISLQGSARELFEDEAVKRAYLGG
ncbi:MAG: ABC transporter ATP-binding protein [Synergistetes bacterium]|nr:ABC transporter ATP-binding protein [Synergistota bacterium]